ncbi:hypothetical protein A2415_00375 [candidate division WWE3 bacterium RIFOXYC1_FULL_39_7]|uniref:Methyltransferase domain-containing protein n=1 Tax=candidate division WWE3 bacterium RIFOXYC1_FULL_39_7 TaxID=1802643 RepID=A0A1F4WI57_UNCKA|nr:MAG: hypothetical protein A2415_00375 [candidate division WWE3 bacterium RIFOXYC1_FULL_39_7]
MIKKLDRLFYKQFRELKTMKAPGYMLDSLEEERRYYEHNKDRFAAALMDLTDEVDLKPGAKILDIGTSPLTFLLKEIYPDVSITTVDYDSKFRERCGKAGIEFWEVDLNSPKLMLLKRKYDAVLFLEVLEHLKLGPAHKRVVKVIIGSMKKSGICILQTPNKYSPKKIVTDSVFKIVWNYLSDVEEKGGVFVHHKEYSLNELGKLIGSFHNVEVLKSTYQMYFDTLASALVYRKKSNLVRLILMINYYLVLNFPFLRRGMVIVFRKKSD